MKVSIKSFDVAMDVRKKGVELEVRSPDGTEHQGDCYVTMTGLVWCRGKTRKRNGTKITWDQIMQICENPDALKAAIKAAKNTSGR